MIWGGKMKKNHPMVQDIYSKFPRVGRIFNCNKHLQVIWSWNLPNKLKENCWMVAPDHILTWNNLEKRGFIGPNIYSLCMRRTEDTEHLLIKCTYARLIWDGVMEEMKLPFDGTNQSLNICLLSWFTSYRKYMSLPLYIIWIIWCSRNARIF